MINGYKFTSEHVNEWMQMRKNGVTLTFIAKKYNTSRNWVATRLRAAYGSTR